MKVAVIGSGISGLSAAWLLSQKYETHLFEKNEKLGGHTNTVFVDKKTEKPIDQSADAVPVDTGFLVHNDRTYPEIIKLFRYLDLGSSDSEMSLAVKVKDINLEWAGNNLRTLFSQKKNLFSVGFWKMILGIVRFNSKKSHYLKELKNSSQNLGDFLKAQKFSKEFVEWYLLPMAGSIWSCPTDQMMAFPAVTFLNFCENHGLLQISDRPQWKTLTGGNYRYIEKMKTKISHIHSGERIESVTRNQSSIQVISNKQTYNFDIVVFACHPPDTMKLLKDVTEQEISILKSFKYQRNKTYLHNDTGVMPAKKLNWSSWNFEAESSQLSKNNVSVSYWINNLQPLSTDKQMIVTLNPKNIPRDVIQELEYEHPIFNSAAVSAQDNLNSIQGYKNAYHCGAWTRFGFHEDGLVSGIHVAKLLGVDPPWDI